MKKILFSVLMVALLCASSMKAFAQAKISLHRPSIAMIMIEDEKLDPQIAPLVKEAFVKNSVGHKFFDHGLNASLKTFFPSSIEVTEADRLAYKEFSGKKVKGGKDAENTALAGGIVGLGGALIGLEFGPSNPAYQNPVVDTVKRQMELKAWLYLQRQGIAKQMMDIWFGVDKGQFGIDEIADRAFYEATPEERKAAKELFSERDVKDAIMDIQGFDLLNTTFVTVSRFRYMTAEDMANEILNGAALAAQFMPRSIADATMSTAELAATTATIAIGKGYCISTDTYLYRLVWNEDVKAAIFDSAADVEKYNALDCFSLEYVGQQGAYSQVAVKNRTLEEAVEYATVRSLDKVIAKLEKNFESFRTVTPITQVEPQITAAIGTKECVEKGEKYDILRAAINKKTGLTEYKTTGTLTVESVGNNLGDANDIEGASNETYTVFKGNAKKLVPGTLIRLHGKKDKKSK